MRVKKLTGTYREVCKILAATFSYCANSLLDEQNIDDVKLAVSKDLNRTSIFGDFAQRIQLRNAWTKISSFTQGDLDGCKQMLTPLCHLVPVDKYEEEIYDESKFIAFAEAYRLAFWNDNNEASGIALVYKHRKPDIYPISAPVEDNWMMIVTTNSAAMLDQRKITIYFSAALCKRFSDVYKLPIVDVELFTDLKEVLQSDELSILVKKSIKQDGKVDIEESRKLDEMAVNFLGDDEELAISLKVIEKRSVIRSLDSISSRKSKIYSSIIDLIEKSYNFRLDNSRGNAQLSLILANKLFEKCEPLLSLQSGQFIEANWSELQQECQLLIEEANIQLVDFKLPDLFFKLDLLYIELYCKRSKLMCENNPLSFRKAQVYDQLMSMVDSVQQLEEEFHFEDAVKLFTLVTQLQHRFEALVSVPEDQILAQNWGVLHKDCHRFIADAKKNLSHYKVSEKWCALDFAYLEIHALKIAFKKSYEESKKPSDHKKAKVCKHLLELLNKADAMRRADYRDDAEGAIELALKLTETCKPYLTSAAKNLDWKQLKKDCKAIVRDAEYKLAYYGFFQIILTNLLLAITGLCLLKAAFTGSFFVHNPSEECFQEFQETASVFKNSGLISG